MNLYIEITKKKIVLIMLKTKINKYELLKFKENSFFIPRQELTSIIRQKNMIKILKKEFLLTEIDIKVVIQVYLSVKLIGHMTILQISVMTIF